MNKLQRLQDEHAAWRAATFPGQTAKGMIAHLKREVRELRRKPSDHMEMADCLLLILGIAHSQKVSAQALIECAFTKLEICKRRQWAPADKDGVFHHLETTEGINS